MVYYFFPFHQLSILQNVTVLAQCHCVKSVRIVIYTGPYFSTFELNTERYVLSVRIRSECRKMRTRITPNTDAFCAVCLFQKKAATVFKTSLNVNKRLKAFKVLLARIFSCGSEGCCKFQNLNKTNIFNHKAGEMHAI